ncbi:MAG: tetratricopeptide repeat protein [Planctomycetes bacterium]|nr:tetratricopeptide repeat protein [Planctomycetota bacterium]
MAGCRSGRARRVQPGEPDPKAAAAATQRGDWRAAAGRWWAVWLAAPEGDARACAEAARALLELGDAESAGNLLDQGLARFPKDANLHEWKARSLEKLGFRRPAEEYLERALALEPNRASALLALGRVRADLGLDAKAVAPLRQYVTQTGGDATSWALLARSLRRSRDTSGAFQAWQRAFELGDPRVEELLSAATLAQDPDLRATHPEAATVCRGWLERALAKDPMCTRAHFQLGLLAQDLGAYEQAVAYYRRAVETDPACLMAITNLAILYSGAGDEEGTRQMVALALDLERDSDRRRALQRLVEPFDKKGEPADPNDPER